MEDEGGAFAQGAATGDPATHGFRVAFDNRKAEANRALTARRAGAGFLQGRTLRFKADVIGAAWAGLGTLNDYDETGLTRGVKVQIGGDVIVTRLVDVARVTNGGRLRSFSAAPLSPRMPAPTSRRGCDRSPSVTRATCRASATDSSDAPSRPSSLTRISRRRSRKGRVRQPRKARRRTKRRRNGPSLVPMSYRPVLANWFEQGPGWQQASAAERLHEFAGEIVGLTVVQRDRTIDHVFESARHLRSQLFRLLQSRPGTPLSTPIRVVPDDHAPARRKAVGGNLMPFDSDHA
jgi:hypothetical protein